MRVQIHPADTGGCGYYRLRWAGEALAAQGADVTFGENLAAVFQRDPDGNEVQIGVHVDADVVVLQRVLTREIADTIPFMQAQGVAVVVEIDDHFHALPRSNPAHRQVDPTRSAGYNADVLQRACELADLVTCTTPGLAKQYGRHGRVQVIPNFARECWLDLPAQQPQTIGWTGAVATHRGDVDEAAAGVRAALDEQPEWSFHALGSELIRHVLKVPESRFSSSGWADLTTLDYPRAIQQLGIGIVPLRDNAFNRLGKSWLKGLEYAACGVPFVASPVGDYRRLPLSFPTARGTAEWTRALRMLIEDPSMRYEIAQQNREHVRDQLTIEGNLDRWMDAWTRAWKNPRTSSRT